MLKKKTSFTEIEQNFTFFKSNQTRSEFLMVY